MIEIDGLNWNPKTDKLISLPDFCTRIIEVLQANNIPFTAHWGKNADWRFPGLIQYMYGDNALLWKQYRGCIVTKRNCSALQQ